MTSEPVSVGEGGGERRWPTDDGVSHTTADIRPALTLLETTNRLVRPPVTQERSSLPGWLRGAAPEGAGEPAEEDPTVGGGDRQVFGTGQWSVQQDRIGGRATGPT
jgi:hypothetical protein